MRAARLHEIGGVPQVDEIDPPAGADLVEIATSALNPIDISIGSGRFYGGSPPTPYVVGSEGVGTTAEGRRVWVRGRQVMSEVVDASRLWTFDLPEGVDNGTALGCGIAGLTAWLAVSWRAPVRSGETVLVLGASGTLGSVAVQAAKLLGAGRVIGAARRTELVPASADEVFDLTSDSDLPGAELIVDGLWGEPIERALAAAPAGVRVVHLGQSAGPTATLQSGWVRGKVATVIGHSLFDVPEEVAAPAFRQLCEHVRDGRIAVETESYPLEAIGEAWRRQASGSPGAKLLIRI